MINRSRAHSPAESPMGRTFAVLALLFLLVAPRQALAHARLKRSSPTAGARLDKAPDMIHLWFTEQPELRLTFASLTDHAGKSFRLGSAEREPAGQFGIGFHVLDVLPAGAYTLSWRTAASDGHPSNGRIGFVVLSTAQLPLASSTAPPPSSERATIGARPDSSASSVSPQAESETDAARSIPNSAARALEFIALLAVVGTICFRLVILPRADGITPHPRHIMEQRAARLGLIATIVLIFVAFGRIYLEAQMMQGMPDMPGMSGMSTRDMLMQTTWGSGMLIQLAAGIGAVVGFALASRLVKSGWFVAAVCALLLAVTPALTGHAAASPRLRSLMVVADYLHVLGAGSWLGSLLCVMAVGIPVSLILEGGERWAHVASLVNSFSPVALTSAAVVVASGIFASWIHLERLAALWQTSYGRILLVKLLFVAITFGLGAYNFRKVQPRLTVQLGAERLRRSAVAELGTALVILLVTGLLTGVSP